MDVRCDVVVDKIDGRACHRTDRAIVETGHAANELPNCLTSFTARHMARAHHEMAEVDGVRARERRRNVTVHHEGKKRQG